MGHLLEFDYARDRFFHQTNTIRRTWDYLVKHLIQSLP